MNLSNIISAGRMMAIVVSLLGAFHCGAAFAQAQEDMVWNIVFGTVVVVCGLVLLVMFRKIAREKASGTPRSTALGTAILIVGTLVALLGACEVALAWRAPFSWMMAIVGLAIFIDALCLRISLSQRQK